MVVLTLDVSLTVRDDAVGAGSACLRRHHGSWFPLAPSGRGDQLGAQLGSQIGIQAIHHQSASANPLHAASPLPLKALSATVNAK